jgi:glycosyltransferase involved in cell wall biosynthesis
MNSRRQIAILCPDLSSNALGRAIVLHELCGRFADAFIMGPVGSKGLWPPARDLRIDIRPFDAHGAWAGGPKRVEQLAREFDVDLLYASKPLPLSFGVALTWRQVGGVPVAVDIDDWERALYSVLPLHRRIWHEHRFNPLAAVKKMEARIGEADTVTVVSTFLQQRFGGVMIPHARDQSRFNPSHVAPDAIRSRLGLEGLFCVMFLGSARPYKGIDPLAQAISGLPSELGCRLGLVWPQNPSRWLKSLVRKYGERILTFPTVPLGEVADYMAAADIIAVPQLSTPQTAGQIPAKIMDAMAMGRPIIATSVSDIPSILTPDAGPEAGIVVPPGDVGALRKALHRAALHPEELSAMGRAARALFVERYSNEAVFPKLAETLIPLMGVRGGEMG